MADVKNLALNPLPLQDPDGGALSLTRLAGFGAAAVALLTTIDGVWDEIFDANTASWAKPIFLLGVVASWSLLAAADVLSRGYAAGRRGELISMPDGLMAVYTPGPGLDKTCAVAGVRFDRESSDDAEFLIVKDGKAVWAQRTELEFKKEEKKEKKEDGR